MNIYFDGGCRPNPGKMSACVVLQRNGTNEPKTMSLGDGTNNIAEWSALIWAVTIAISDNIRNPNFLGDSQLVVNQASHKWKIKDQTLADLYDEFHKLTAGLRFTIDYVPRNQNLAGIYLENNQV